MGQRGRIGGRIWGMAGAIFLVLITGLTANAVEERFFRIGTAATTGTYFQLGGVLASALSKPEGGRDCAYGGSCGVPGLIVLAQATQGSIENVLEVGKGQLDSALSQSDIAYWAYTGAAATPKRCTGGKPSDANADGASLLKKTGPITSLRAIAGLYPEHLHIVVSAETSITRLHDLRGKRVSLGQPESGTLADARLVLEAAGLSECSIKARYLGLAQAVEALRGGEIDAFFLVAGAPVPAITEFAGSAPIRLLPIDPDLARRIIDKFPFFTADTIAPGLYPGQESEVPSLQITALWVVSETVPEDLVYAITKGLWSEPTRRLLEAAHPLGARIRLATALQGVVVPLHPGAARFYRENSMTLPATLPPVIR
ncbi:MAG TPA: TAXI family TRAP transporter solute-binding subunit [Stellaceae bacterium]|nr:TAXI family TRAP transporter solute-binding subunit [Stellaceae bacterium]